MRKSTHLHSSITVRSHCLHSPIYTEALQDPMSENLYAIDLRPVATIIPVKETLTINYVSAGFSAGSIARPSLSASLSRWAERERPLTDLLTETTLQRLYLHNRISFNCMPFSK